MIIPRWESPIDPSICLKVSEKMHYTSHNRLSPLHATYPWLRVVCLADCWLRGTWLFYVAIGLHYASINIRLQKRTIHLVGMGAGVGIERVEEGGRGERWGWRYIGEVGGGEGRGGGCDRNPCNLYLFSRDRGWLILWRRTTRSTELLDRIFKIIHVANVWI